ncbi:MAG: hypothetical protein QXO30_00820 [Candidatus Caldarchaeum sp.]
MAKKVGKIIDIPAEEGDELHADTVPIELTDEFIELLRRGIGVLYRLR